MSLVGATNARHRTLTISYIVHHALGTSAIPSSLLGGQATGTDGARTSPKSRHWRWYAMVERPSRRAGRETTMSRMQNAVSAPAIPRRADPYREQDQPRFRFRRVASGNPAAYPAVLDENGSAHVLDHGGTETYWLIGESSSRTTGSPPHHDGQHRGQILKAARVVHLCPP